MQHTIYKKTIALNTPVADIFLNEELKFVHVIWKGAVTNSDAFRDTLNFGTQLIKDYRCERWLADTKNMGVIKRVDQEWTHEVWFPQVATLGLKKMALIVPENVFGELSAKNVMDKARDKNLIKDRYFMNTELAIKWLIEK